MADEQFLAMLAIQATMERLLSPEAWWWLSFATEKAFLGGILVRANGPVTARLRTAELGFNPGGEMLAVPCPDGAPLPEER